jgi:uncharacterized membrane protein
MASGHTHLSAAPEAGPAVRVDRRTRLLLIGLVAVIGLATGAAAAWLWPRGPLPHTAAVEPVQEDTLAATVVAVQRHTCAGSTDDRLADGSVPATVTCAAVKVRLGEGRDAGAVVPVQVTGPVADEGLVPGIAAVVARFPDDPAAGAPSSASGGATRGKAIYAWVDFDRRQPMWLLAAVFVLVVLVVARFRGLAALAGVGAGFAMVASHGISAKTTTALVGTVGALGVSAGAAVWAASAAHLDGQTGEDAFSLAQLVGARTISAAVISGIVLAGLGVLNDVTVTQASAVWELKAAAPHLHARELVTRGMRIGRDHLASTVYTIAFAYAGVSLPVLLLIQVQDRPLTEVITSAPIAQDVVGVLVGGIGLALAIPLTTFVAALVAATSTPAMASVRSRVRAGRDADVEVPVRTAGGRHGGSSGGEDEFEEGLLLRRRRRRDERTGHGRLDRPADDQLSLDDTDWSSWPT